MATARAWAGVPSFRSASRRPEQAGRLFHPFFRPALTALFLALALAGGWMRGDEPARNSLQITTESDGEVIHFIAQNPEAMEITATFEVDLFN